MRGLPAAADRWLSREATETAMWIGDLSVKSCVYFVLERDNQESAIKIGVTRNLFLRLSGMQSGNPRRLIVRQIIRGLVDDEKRLHRRFEEAHVGGEWFGNGYQAEILTYADLIANEQCIGARMAWTSIMEAAIESLANGPILV
jgi:hypothetical protein